MPPNYQLLNATATRYKRVYLRYVAALDIDEKARYFLQREQTFDADTVHFLFYPRLFSEAFGLRENKTFQNVCIAGFLYYRSLITIDSFFDEKQKKLGLTDLTIMMTFQEEAIKILGSIFKPASPFWSLWNKRKAEYLQGFAIETSTPPKTKEEFKKLADLKSAFGKVAIDACFMLSTRADRNVVYQRALKAHAEFSWANQVLDDLQDLQADAEQGQPNFITTMLAAAASGSVMDVKEIKVQLYQSDAIFKFLDTAKAGYDVALKHFSSDLWNALIQKLLSLVQLRAENVRGYQAIEGTRSRFSTTPYALLHSTDLPAQSELAWQFLQREQHADGSWKDFFTKAGLSNVWATGFVATTLNANGKNKALTRAQSFLKKQRQKPFWGYSTRWIPDLDSTTFVLMALQSCQADAAKEFKHWTLCQRKDGGFSTYPDRSSLDQVFAGEFQNYDGWMQSHVCVSSAALYFLAQQKPNRKTDATVKKLVDFLERNISADGLWHSYWWTSPVYATSYALRGLVTMGFSPDEPRVAKGFNALVQLQCDDGAFQNRFREVSAFFTGLALLAFTCHENVFRKYEEPATRAANWLLANQLSDGSFSPAYQLQIPAPGCTQPADVASWTKSIAAGTNVLCCDIMRLFSTAVCKEAFQAFMKYTTVRHVHTANQSLQLS